MKTSKNSSTKKTSTKKTVKTSKRPKTTSSVSATGRIRATRKNRNVKKSILGAIFGKRKSNKIFGIYVVDKSEKTKYIRFISVMNDLDEIEYVPTFVDKFSECSKYTSMESAREHLASIKEKYGLEEAKIVEQLKD